jgi:hypothetical protein
MGRRLGCVRVAAWVLEPTCVTANEPTQGTSVMSDADDTFTHLLPIAQFTDQEVAASTRALESGSRPLGPGVVASVVCRRIAEPSTFAVAFATRDGNRIGPFLLTPGVVAELRKALEDSVS